MKKQDDAFYEEPIFSDKDFKIIVSDKTSVYTETAFHSAIEIKLFFQGSSMQTIGAETVIADPDDITVANPYELHTNIMTELYNGKYHLIIVDLDFFENTGHLDVNLRNLLLVNGGRFHNHIKNNVRLNAILLNVVSEINEKKPQYKAVIRNLMGEFFSLLLRDEFEYSLNERLFGKGLEKVRLLAPAITKIFTDYNKSVTVDELAQLCHLSKYYFCRVFKQVMGVTPVNYIIHHKIRVAKVLLSDRSKSTAQVAQQCGFNDISYFYRCYKKITGTTPRS